MRQGSNSRRSRSGRANGKRAFSSGSNRSFESNGPSVKLRGTAVQIFDKYVALARDATSAGDRIAAENYYQHAEHYYRMMNGAGRPNGDGQQRRDGANGDGRRSNGDDWSDEDEGAEDRAADSPPASAGKGGDPAEEPQA